MNYISSTRDLIAQNDTWHVAPFVTVVHILSVCDVSFLLVLQLCPKFLDDYLKTSAIDCTFLQGLIAEKESKIAEMDAASSGEAVRFRAAMENVKGELIHLKQEHV